MTTALILLVAATGVCFGAVAYSGMCGRRRWHLRFVAAALPLAALTIAVAERVGKDLDYEPTRFVVHMGFAYSAVVALAVVVVLGVLRLRLASFVKPHRVAAFAFLALLALAVATGAWMLGTATPKASGGPGMERLQGMERLSGPVADR